MLEHLVEFTPEIEDRDGFVGLERAATDELLSAQVKTTHWLEELGVTPDTALADDLEKDDARKAFQALALSTDTDTAEKKAALAALKTPAAVRHLTGMLAAYDWEFIEQAKELRGYTVAKLVEETTNPNANIRLKALGLLGKVTEVGLFTEKVEIKKTEFTDAELEQRIKDKLNRFMGVVDVVEIETKPEIDAEIAEIPQETGEKAPGDPE